MLVDGILRNEDTGGGRITIDGAPEFVFLGPTNDLNLADDPNDSIGFSWRGRDPEATATVRLGIDVDLDSDQHASGNEIYIHETTLGAEEDDAEFIWDGNDDGGERVAAGTYRVFALIDDSVNAVLQVELSNALITVE